MKHKRIDISLILILAISFLTLVLEFCKINYTSNTLHNAYISKIIQQGIGGIAVVLLLLRLKIKLFNAPQNWLYLIPALLIALDNFQWSSFFHGNMEMIHDQPADILLFAGYCLSVGMFEEFIFRGIIFAVLLGYFPKTQEGLWKAYIASCLVFALAHLFNGLSFGTILQVGYTFLTGGLFGFVLLKTKNLFCCGVIHAIYNFCGLLFETPERMGLGGGVVFDTGTVLTMLFVSLILGAFVLYSIYKYPESERKELYLRLDIKEKE